MPPNRSNSDIHPRRESRRLFLSVAIGLGSCLYLLWFLSFPILEGYYSADGQPVTRLQFLSRIMLPELWLSEITAGGRLPVGIVDRIPVLFGAVVWYATAYFSGRSLVSQALSNGRITRLEHIALAILAGLALLSTLTLLVGLAGGSSNSWPILVGVAILLAVAFGMNAKQRHSTQRFVRTSWFGSDLAPSGVFGQLAGRLVVVLTLGLGAVYLLGITMPPYEFDVVEYHLQSAKEFYQQGYIGFNDHNVYVNMPLALEMHSLAAMSLVNGADGWWLGGLIGKTIVGGHGLLAAALIGGYCARHYGAWVGWCAAGTWLAVPGNAHVSFTGLIDCAQSTYVLAGIMMLTEFWHNHSVVNSRSTSTLQNSDSAANLWLLFIAGIYTGEVAAIKYTGLIYVIFPAILWVVLIFLRLKQNRDWRRFALWSACGILGGAITCIPWYAKNAVLTGNPVYPLAYSVFGGRNLDASRAQQWADAHRVPVDVQTGSAYSISAAWQSTQQVLVKSEFMQPTLAILVLCAIAAGWTSRRGIYVLPTNDDTDSKHGFEPGARIAFEISKIFVWLTISLWILAIWWLMTHRIDRFWLPAVSIWSALAGVGVAWLASRVSHALATVCVLFGLFYGCIVNSSPALGDNRYFVTLDALRRDSGDDEHVGRISRAIDWCNGSLSHSGTKVLLVGEARVFDCQFPIIYSTCFNRSPAEMWLRGITRADQGTNLRAQGITHLLVNWSEIARYRSPGNYGFSDWPQKDDIEEFVQSGLMRRMVGDFDPAVTEVLEVVSEERGDEN